MHNVMVIEAVAYKDNGSFQMASDIGLKWLVLRGEDILAGFTNSEEAIDYAYDFIHGGDL